MDAGRHKSVRYRSADRTAVAPNPLDRAVTAPQLTTTLRRPLNVVLLIVDSLRAQSPTGNQLAIPFFHRLDAETMSFRRAYATECWTLPTHPSMFTGLLPSEHGAHFQTMAYECSAPTIAETARRGGLLHGVGDAELRLRRHDHRGDARLPGASRPLAKLSRTNLVGLFLALAKPRVRRHIRRTGFFHPRHTDQRAFVRTFARSLMPADELALARVLEVMAAQQRARRPYFICCNLYDVHAPYPPAADSLLRPWRSVRQAVENLALRSTSPSSASTPTCARAFDVSGWAQQVLRDRYHRAIELMDAKLAAFSAAARSSGLLDDTLLIITSDHGEAFGEHGLYLHDASVYDTHLHVPLWIRIRTWPRRRSTMSSARKTCSGSCSPRRDSARG